MLTRMKGVSVRATVLDMYTQNMDATQSDGVEGCGAPVHSVSVTGKSTALMVSKHRNLSAWWEFLVISHLSFSSTTMGSWKTLATSLREFHRVGMVPSYRKCAGGES